MTDEPRKMVSEAPWPTELEDLVLRIRCSYGWTFRLEYGTFDDDQVSQLRLIITVHHHDSYHPENRRATQFHYPVPAVMFDRASWQRWIRDRMADLHVHEDGEALAFAYQRPLSIADGDGGDVEVLERPFAPFHGPGRDPNRNVEVGVDPMEARVSQWGGRYPGYWWDGHLVHDDAEHDRELTFGNPTCIPVQLVEDAS